MKVLSNNYHPDSIFGLFVGREMIIKNLSLTSRKKCIEKYNFEGDMMPFTWRVCAKIRGPPVVGVPYPFFINGLKFVKFTLHSCSSMVNDLLKTEPYT